MSTSAPSTSRPRGNMQHKREAYWFYRFLSMVYDQFVNPMHWTADMRDQSLVEAGLTERGGQLDVVDVGGGTGFCTEGILKYVPPERVTLLDQSLAQMAKAKTKQSLKGITIVEGDAEKLPFATDSVDRYVSAGSIEYWPEPARGISEAYRVVKPGGIATIIGPVRATNPISRFFCDMWMLFPEEEQYRLWFEQAGFQDVKVSYIGPPHYRGIREHGLIMGLTVTGSKKSAGLPKVQLPPSLTEDRSRAMSWADRIVFVYRFTLGLVGGIYYFLLPLAVGAYAFVFVRQRPN
eukprot:CAMPEP_0184678448 /NCGR_PEP_ID=MMETSP0312-20130426/1192_1 /TAXON_ID=31354 /ORGANISM="Compsopogon coeruleus, Strain SAG 36.94" /LENGTH=291 /DNA_ID=CAMNT_0027127197 /DNA_START=205 /DNA_END=1080 /DNA_ORIENTATION=+